VVLHQTNQQFQQHSKKDAAVEMEYLHLCLAGLVVQLVLGNERLDSVVALPLVTGMEFHHPLEMVEPRKRVFHPL